jgi:lipopolysaccharide/colanic/teichoic acid biosynthesis glycosyltransferase
VGSFRVEDLVVPGSSSLFEQVDADRPTVVVLDRRAQEEPSIVAQVAALHERGVRVRTLTGFYEEWLGKLPISELERASLLFDIRELHRAAYGRAKRLFDLPVAIVGGVVLVLVMPLVWLGNRVANRGPLLYRQVRVGKGGSTFTILKLRTMVPPSSGDLVDEWTSEDDPRITRFGRVLRVTHLDELPQVLNVLRGDLSLVGPRPEQPRYVEELSEKLPFYRLRHLVRPGITGWAQVKYGYAGSESAALEKLQYEFWYLRHQSLRTDVRILGRTVRSVFGGEGSGR